MKLKDLEILNQAFLRVNNLDKTFPVGDFDGILGLAFEGLEPADTLPDSHVAFLTNLAKIFAGKISQGEQIEPVFAFEMTDAQGNDEKTGKVHLGSIPEKFGMGNATDVSVAPVLPLSADNLPGTGFGYWMFNLGGSSVNEQTFGGGLAVADSGIIFVFKLKLPSHNPSHSFSAIPFMYKFPRRV